MVTRPRCCDQRPQSSLDQSPEGGKEWGGGVAEKERETGREKEKKEREEEGGEVGEGETGWWWWVVDLIF